MRTWTFVIFECCRQYVAASIPKRKRLVPVLALFLFKSTLLTAQQGGITRIYTDFNGYWTSSSTAISSVRPDNSHNLLGFSWNGQTYSTGVNDNTLTTQGVSFTPMKFQAFPVRNITLAGTGALPGLGQLKDGVDNGASVPAPFTQPPNISSFLTDGLNGLDIGTGVANVPSGTLIFDFGGIIDPSQIGDGLPDILVSQIADPSSVLDSVYFTDGSGNLVGNKIAINHTSSTIPSVGKWVADFYNANGTLAGGYTKTERTIRVWAADISAFGINGSNYSPALTLRYRLNGSSDPAFLAFNNNIITVTSANDDVSNTQVDAFVNIPVLNNDQPAAALDRSSLQSVTGPAHGTLSINTVTGIITYTPAAGYSGIDRFTYRVCNNNSATPQCDDAEVTVNVGNADLSVTQSASNNTPPLSSYVTFTITAANAGINNAYGVRVDDILPAGYTFVSATTAAGSYNNTTGVWTIGNLGSGTNAVLSITALVNISGSYSNTATISGTLFDPVNGNNTSVITLAPVAASSDMQVTKTADNITAPAGTNVIFTITALNQGPSNATGIKVTDLLPSGFLYVSHNAASGTSYNNTTGTWNIGAMGTGTNKILTITATVKNSGSYTNTASISSTTADPDMANNSASVTITPAVGTPAFSGGASSSRCQSSATVTYAATANNTTGITYSIAPAEAGTMNASTGEMTWANSFSGTATITANAAGVNGPATTTHTVTVAAAATTPVFTAGPTSERCQGAGANSYTATSDHSSGITYALTPASAGTINASTGEVTWSPPFNGTATITATATGCNGAVSATHTATINTLPSATIAYAGSPFCKTGSATVTLAGQTGGTFSAPSGLVIDSNTGEIDLAASTAGHYTITYTFSNGTCGNTTTTTIDIHANPVLVIHNPAAVCAPQTVDLTNTGVTAGSSTGLSFSYYTDAIAATPLNNPSAINAAGTYYIKATNTNGCSVIDAVTVHIDQLPATTISYSNSEYCTYGTAAASINGQPGGTFSSSAGLALDATSGTIDLAASTPGNYTITYAYSNGVCNGSTGTAVTIVNPVLTITNPTPVCAPATIDLTNSAITAGNAPGLSFTYFNDAAGSSVLSNPSAITVTGTYYIKGTHPNGCSTAPQPVQAVVNSRPVINITAPAGEVCKGAAVTLTASSPGNNVSWQHEEGGSSITVRPVANTVYSVTATDGNGCTNTATTTVEVSNFALTLQANRNPVLAGTPVTLQASANENFEAITWTPIQFFNSQNSKTQTITISDTAKTMYVVGRSQQGCLDTASLKINVDANTGDVFVPNAFTPNGDGKNDVFKVFGSSVMSVEMKIYTQWGNLVFETKDNNTGWNGIYNGKAQPVGVYIYVIRIRLYNNDTIIKKGNLHLLR